MTQPSHSPTASPTPPPGTFPAPPPDDISQEDRLFAAAAYLSYFAGFWMVAPAVIYVLRREKSRFVAHHAIRAMLIQGFLIPAVLAGFILSLSVGILLASAGERAARHSSGAFTAFWALMIWGSWLLPIFVHLAITVLTAISAFQGRIRPDSLLGRLTERILSHDKSVASK